MAHRAIDQHRADWVIHSDADEFWWPTEGNLKSVLETVPTEFQVVAVPRYDFIPRPESIGPLFDRMVIKDLNPLNHIGKPLPPKVCHRAMPEVVVAQGNHKLKQPEGLEHFETPLLEIMHFPMRSYRQFENKIALGGAAYERNKELPKTMAMGWRRLYEDYKQGKLIDYYESKILPDNEIERRMREGTFMVDERLKQFLERKGIKIS